MTKFYEIKLAILTLADDEEKNLINYTFTNAGFQNIIKAMDFLKKLDVNLLEQSILDSFLKDNSSEEKSIVKEYGKHFVKGVKDFIRAD